MRHSATLQYSREVTCRNLPINPIARVHLPLSPCLLSSHTLLTSPSARCITPKCLYASFLGRKGTSEPSRITSLGSSTSHCSPPTHLAPVTTVLRVSFTPSFCPMITSHADQHSHARRSSHTSPKPPAQSSANAMEPKRLHSSSEVPARLPHNLIPLASSSMAAITELTKSLARSGDSTHPISAPMLL